MSLPFLQTEQHKKDLLEQKRAEAESHVRAFLKLRKDSGSKPVDHLHSLLSHSNNYLEDGAGDYENLFSKLIEHFMVAQNMNALDANPQTQKEIASQLGMLHWFFQSIQESYTMACIVLYDVKVYCKELRVKSYLEEYKEKAEIAAATKSIREKRKTTL